RDPLAVFDEEVLARCVGRAVLGVGRPDGERRREGRERRQQVHPPRCAARRLLRDEEDEDRARERDEERERQQVAAHRCGALGQKRPRTKGTTKISATAATPTARYVRMRPDWTRPTAPPPARTAAPVPRTAPSTTTVSTTPDALLAPRA